jgi:TonB-linked SusC/RagA family outer membrane protein
MFKKAVIVLAFIFCAQILFSQVDSSIINIQKKDSTEFLEIGYLKINKENIPGAVTLIDSKDFNDGVIIYPQELIIGKTPGLLIYPGGIIPENAPSAINRGNTTVYTSSTEPIYVVDDVPVEKDFLNFLNQSDIEQITIVRDGLGAAIYGTQAANGAIVIKTKTPILNKKLRVNYHGYLSISQLAKKVDVFSGDELKKIIIDNENNLYLPEYLENLGLENTDWQSEIYRNAVSYNHHVGFSGGLGFLPYRVSLGYTNNNSILKNTGLKRTSASINLAPSFFNNTLNIRFLTYAALTNNNFGDVGAIKSAISMDPTQPVYDGNENSAGYFQWENHGANLGTANPVEQLLEADNKSKTKRFITNLQIAYYFPFVNGLKTSFSFKSISSVVDGHHNRPVTSPQILVAPSGNGLLTDYYQKRISNLLDLYFNYEKELNEISSKINLTAGYFTQKFESNENFYRRSVVDESNPYQLLDSSSFSNSSSLASLYGNFGYSLKNKYFLMASVRRDANSLFPSKNQWGLFPYYSVSWNIHNEKFLNKISFLNNLRFHASYGKSGVNYSYYSAESLYNPASPSTYDPDLTWEIIISKNLGVDFAIFNNRISASVNFYQKNIEDMIVPVTIPSGSGFSQNIIANVGELENNGFEVALNVVPVSSTDWHLSFGFNFSQNESKLIKLQLFEDPDYIGILYGNAFTGNNQITTEGEPLRSFFVNRQIYDTNGNPIEGVYDNISGEPGVIAGDPDDKYVYKNPKPNYFLGFSMNFKYKKLEFSGSAHANIGNYMYNMLAAGASYDQIRQIGYWKNMPTYLNDTKFISRQFSSDYFVQNASFLKIDYLTIAYTFIVKEKNRAGIRAYFTAQNPIMWTKYKGINPEIESGIDEGNFPYAKAI